MSGNLPELPAEAFLKEDASDDAKFYEPARLVTHIDETATQALTLTTEPLCRLVARCWI